MGFVSLREDLQERINSALHLLEKDVSTVSVRARELNIVHLSAALEAVKATIAELLDIATTPEIDLAARYNGLEHELQEMRIEYGRVCTQWDSEIRKTAALTNKLEEKQKELDKALNKIEHLQASGAKGTGNDADGFPGEKAVRVKPTLKIINEKDSAHFLKRRVKELELKCSYLQHELQKLTEP